MKEKDNKAFWERFARLYGPFMKKSSELYENIAIETEKSLSKEMNVLELACGSGQLSFLLADRVKLWEATDFSPKMIEEAKKKIRPKNLHFSVMDATNIPYTDSSFDAVMIANALHIMPDPKKALGEIRRVLKDGGILFAPTFTREDSFKASLRIKIMSLGGFKTYYNWHENEFMKFIEESGFKVTETKMMMAGGFIPLCYLKAENNKKERS